MGRPGFVGEPFFDGADITFGNSLGLRAVASDNHMDKVGLGCHLLKNLSGKVYTSI